VATPVSSPTCTLDWLSRPSQKGCPEAAHFCQPPPLLPFEHEDERHAERDNRLQDVQFGRFVFPSRPDPGIHTSCSAGDCSQEDVYFSELGVHSEGPMAHDLPDEDALRHLQIYMSAWRLLIARRIDSWRTTKRFTLRPSRDELRSLALNISTSK